MSSTICPYCSAEQVVGIEVQGVYDGVLYWMCNECKRAWNRWFTDNSRMFRVAEEHVAAHNEKMKGGE